MYYYQSSIHSSLWRFRGLFIIHGVYSSDSNIMNMTNYHKQTVLIHENACFPAAIGDNTICQIMLKPKLAMMWNESNDIERNCQTDITFSTNQRAILLFLHLSIIQLHICHILAWLTLSHCLSVDSLSFIALEMIWHGVEDPPIHWMWENWCDEDSRSRSEAKWIGASGWHRFLNGIHNKHTTNECTM